MNFRDLEYLVAVAELAHFGKAAESCHVSQSALSLQLQKLEKEVGAQLFERTNRRVVVTEVGQEMALRARELLQGRRELLDTARLFGGGMPASVRIGAIPTIAPYLFGHLYSAFSNQFPGTEVLFEEEVTGKLEPGISSGNFEIGILATPIHDSLLDEYELFEEPFLLAVSSTHLLANRSFVEPKDLASEKLLLLKDTHCLRDQTMRFCETHHIKGKTMSAASSIHTILTLVRLEGGVSVIPRMAMENKTPLEGICCIPIQPSPTRKVRVVFRKTSRVGLRLAEIIREIPDLSKPCRIS